MTRPRIAGKTIYIATSLMILAFGGGFAMAAITVSSGSSETAAGQYNGASALSFWALASGQPVGLSSTPGTVPTQIASAVGSPTVLAAAGQSYMVNAGTAGDVAQFFKFTETTGAPVNTEVELVFTVSTGSSPSIATTTVYIETQSAAPGSAQTFTLYYDLGSAASSSVVVNSVQVVSQQCNAVGTCP